MRCSNPTIPKIAPCPTPRFEHPIHLCGRQKIDTPRIAILLPTRGTLFSLAIESILREATRIERYEVALFMCHDLPIPDSVNYLVNRATNWHADYTWLVEEDNYMPPGVLEALIDTDEAVVACDYFNHQGTTWELESNLGPIPFVAFGCTLVKSNVWEAIGPLSIAKIPQYQDGKIHYVKGDTYGYGGQDVDFSLKVHNAGFRVARLPHDKWRCGHMHVETYGELKKNVGFHTVKIM